MDCSGEFDRMTTLAEAVPLRYRKTRLVARDHNILEGGELQSLSA